MTDEERIKRLGGVKNIAKFFGFKKPRVHNWLHRGIPKDMKLDYPEYFLSDNPKPLPVQTS